MDSIFLYGRLLSKINYKHNNYYYTKILKAEHKYEFWRNGLQMTFAWLDQALAGDLEPLQRPWAATARMWALEADSSRNGTRCTPGSASARRTRRLHGEASSAPTSPSRSPAAMTAATGVEEAKTTARSQWPAETDARSWNCWTAVTCLTRQSPAPSAGDIDNYYVDFYN